MKRLGIMLCATAILLAACSATARFSGAVNDAKQAGRPIVVYEINPHTEAGEHSRPLGVYFINTASEPLQSVAFKLLPYQSYTPMHRAIKVFTARGPFAPNHAYRFLGSKRAWHKFEGYLECVHLIGMTVRRIDGRVTRIDKGKIDEYVTPNVNTPCVRTP
jgi:predicted small secreted protein